MTSRSWLVRSRGVTGFFVVLMLVVGLVGAAAAELPPGGTFTDDDGNIHESNIEAIAAEGITKGCNPPTNDRYCPSDRVTRGQMAAFLVRALGLTEGLDDPFTDDGDSVFEADIERLAAAGITRGCNPPTNDRFCPDDDVTRGQMAAFLVRAMGYTDDGGGDLFIDDDDSVFEGDIDRLGTAGVTKGCNPPTNDRFCPNDYVLRDQMASFLARALALKAIDVPTPATPVAACLVTDPIGVDDRSFNAAAWQGVLDAEAAGFVSADPILLEPDDETDFAPSLDKCLASGADHIVTVGFQLGGDTETYAEAHPGVKFTTVDVPYDPDISNVRELIYQADEAAFAAGYLAAGVSQSGIVGTYGGLDFPAVTVFMDGFARGVEHYNAVKAADVTLIGWDVDTQTGTFAGTFDPANPAARSTCESMLDAGADIVLPVGGSINLPCGTAIQDRGLDAALIGVDQDAFLAAPAQYRDLWLTTIEKGITIQVMRSLQDHAEGNWTPGNELGNLANDAVGLSEYHSWADRIPAGLSQEVEQVIDDVAAGKLTWDKFQVG